MWETPKAVILIWNDETGTGRAYFVDASSPWQRAVCRLATRIGDVLSAGRRKSQPLDWIHSRTRIGFLAYTHLRALLLYRTRAKGVFVQTATGRRFVLG